ncbi:hypothetical protein ASL11_09405 [Paenibacillus sp. Soil750]|nr:hypothetical protein ASL11_09405 [Paenibacillus sp. Soil750]
MHLLSSYVVFSDLLIPEMTNFDILFKYRIIGKMDEITIKERFTLASQWLTEIKNTINYFKNEVPEGRTLLTNIDSMDIEQLLSILSDAFVLEEDAIEAENRKNFVTDTYENNVRFFAKQLISSMITSHNELKEYEEYQTLLTQRHIAYGFYSALGNNSAEGIPILKDSYIEKLLYSGLVKFYNKFYGSFSDNQEAIKLLCKFYPANDSLLENKDDIVSALFRHVSNAGTSSDTGFAFRGIELIKENIGRLPIDVIDQLLQKYELYRIINEKVYRHQVFTIIDNASMTEEEKQTYKFSYLDSLILANVMNSDLYSKYGNQEHLSRNYLSSTQTLKAGNIGLIFNDYLESTYAYWTHQCSIDRQFVVDGKEIIHIRLHIAQKQVSVAYLDMPRTEIRFEFLYNDWMLDQYRAMDANQKLLEFINGDHDEQADPQHHRLTFSLLFLHRYRGLHKQLVDFDHRFTYNTNTNELNSVLESPDISHFYGEKIYSLSCIVGKNGTGKTSTVDFLRGTFFKLLHLIDEQQITCNQGYVKEIDYEAYGILDSGSEFFVVFHLGDQPYYLTNIIDATASAAKPFDSKTYTTVNKLGKVVYFSNMLSVHQDNLFSDGAIAHRDKSDKEKLALSLNHFGQADYSEASSFIQKRKDMESAEWDNPLRSINRDLCYQLTFLACLPQGELQKYFDMPEDKVFTIKSELLGLEEVGLTATNVDKKLASLQPFFTAPDTKLKHFSSGQYAKFSFLAKLYWFLEGHRKYAERLGPYIGTNIFSQDEVLQEWETALLFIDEGELYYHPEWQRKFVTMLINFIHSTSIESQIQIVITTNSPFMISDILSEDITYLSKEQQEFDQTFGQNIHKLLKHNFFMSYTIGEYSRELIERIIDWLCLKEDEVSLIGKELSRYFEGPIAPVDYSKKIRLLINKIGEPVYREKLLDTLSTSKLEEPSELELLLRQRADLDREIRRLSEGERK